MCLAGDGRGRIAADAGEPDRLRLGRRNAGRDHEGASRSCSRTPTSSQIIGSTQAPNTNALAGACALATDYHGIQFPSLPNYLALTSGQVPPAIAGDGVNGLDCQPSPTCRSTDPSIFTQIGAAAAAAADPATAPTWRTYAESMPANCGLVNSGEYAARHNPAVYYPNDAAACAVDDVPSGTPAAGAFAIDLAAGTLPSYGLFIPNLCNDGHNSCGGVPRVAEEDATIAAWMPQILASPDYQSGHLLVVITADSSASASNGNLLATVLINPDVLAGTQVATRFDHYSLLRLERGAARPAAARKCRGCGRHGARVQSAAAAAPPPMP